VRIIREVKFVDQTIRDGQQSLWGMRMRGGMILPIAPTIARAGYDVVDYVGSSMFECLVRYCQEDPWEGLRRVVKQMPDTIIRGGTRSNGMVSFKPAPDSVMDLWVKTLCVNGIRSFWIYDNLYNWDKISRLTKVAKEHDAEVVVAIMYSLSPIYTDEYFAEKAREIAQIPGVDGIYLEDADGILTPERVRTLIPAIRKNASELKLEFHMHNTTGIAPLCYLEAVKLGVDRVHTASRPLANGPSLPSTEIISKNLRYLGYQDSLDNEALADISSHFTHIANSAGLPTGVPQEYDLAHYDHQLPGGMTGTLLNQLRAQNMEHRFSDILDEIALVRKELGYPVMATPFSQIIGAQAVINIIQGERYQLISDELIQYVLGHYGPIQGTINQNILDKILSSPRARDFKNWELEQPSIEQLRRKLGIHLTDEELLLRYFIPKEMVDKALSTPFETNYSNGARPVTTLIAELAKQNYSYIHLIKGDFKLTMQSH
jgi:oxaloacetate decarboxylase (Na+ extruding) subunit alpha